jgi:dihydrolipoamide dehydrogenase
LCGLLHEAEDFGLKNVKADVDIKAMVTRSRQVAGQLEKGVAGLMKKNKIDVIEGRGFIADATHIEVRNGDQMHVLETDFIIIASGARARVPQGVPTDSPLVWTAREAMTPKSIPKSLLVVGSGAIGVEFASFYQDIGSRVTLIEAAAHILPREDVDISMAAAEALSGRGIEIKTECRFENVKPASKSVSVSLAMVRGHKTDVSMPCFWPWASKPMSKNYGMMACR